MQIDKLKHQHIDILRRVAALRTLTHEGVVDNAQAIAEGIVRMSAVIKLHLAVEDQALNRDIWSIVERCTKRMPEHPADTAP